MHAPITVILLKQRSKNPTITLQCHPSTITFNSGCSAPQLHSQSTAKASEASKGTGNFYECHRNTKCTQTFSPPEEVMLGFCCEVSSTTQCMSPASEAIATLHFSAAIHPLASACWCTIDYAPPQIELPLLKLNCSTKRSSCCYN